MNDTMNDERANLISQLQSVRDRWMSVVVSQNIGDQLDGDFDILLDAINALKRDKSEAIAALRANAGGVK